MKKIRAGLVPVTVRDKGAEERLCHPVTGTGQLSDTARTTVAVYWGYPLIGGVAASLQHCRLYIESFYSLYIIFRKMVQQLG